MTEAGEGSVDVVVAAVTARTPIDGRETRSRHQILVALGRLPDPSNERADPTHLTASAIVLGPKGVLLHRHKRLGLWLQPGGHIEPGESPWEAARREATEETGLELEWPSAQHPPPLAHVDVHPAANGHIHLDLRYLLTPAGDDAPHPPAGESQDVRWFEWDEAIAVADPGLRGLLDRLAALYR
jgi:8-oxo-dGTP pyrophosphatase MutT (NUDIX family)